MKKSFEQSIHDNRKLLQNPYAYAELLEKFNEDQSKLWNSCVSTENLDSINIWMSGMHDVLQKTSSKKTDRDIERIVKRVHKQIWHDRDRLFPDYKEREPVDMLNPIVVLHSLGYEVETVGALGQLPQNEKRVSNVAGLIDTQSHKVLLSGGYSPSVRNFTAAHELGHAVMHEFVGMHRDKPLDGSTRSSDLQEREADKFAVYFLMPATLMKNTFEKVFGKSPFILDESRKFALIGSVPDIDRQLRSLRDLSRVLSTVSRFNGLNFIPLFEQFHVSREAMAIRLEELKLVIFH
jgi:Zn-dependent peptidase ImmA (M78 family)